MTPSYFSFDGRAVLLTLIASALLVLWLMWKKKETLPRLRFSLLEDLSAPSSISSKVLLANLPRRLLIASLILFSIAFMDPHFQMASSLPPQDEASVLNEDPSENSMEETPIPTEGIGIYLVLDRSGSMAQEVSILTREGKRRSLSRLDYMKLVTHQFIKGNSALGLGGRPDDMIGLVAFARTAHILTPLTLDHKAVLDELSRLDLVKNKTYDGTAMGYAIYKTVNLIVATRYFAEELEKEGDPAYTIKSTVIILVTDGLQNVNPLDQNNALRTMNIEMASQHAQENGVKLYIVNIEPAIKRPEFEPHRSQLEKAARRTGGQFYIADDNASLPQIYHEIDQLEKGILPQQLAIESEVKEKIKQSAFPNDFKRFSLYPHLIALGLFCFFVGIVLETTWLRRVP